VCAWGTGLSVFASVILILRRTVGQEDTGKLEPRTRSQPLRGAIRIRGPRPAVGAARAPTASAGAAHFVSPRRMCLIVTPSVAKAARCDLGAATMHAGGCGPPCTPVNAGRSRRPRPSSAACRANPALEATSRRPATCHGDWLAAKASCTTRAAPAAQAASASASIVDPVLMTSSRTSTVWPARSSAIEKRPSRSRRCSALATPLNSGRRLVRGVAPAFGDVLGAIQPLWALSRRLWLGRREQPTFRHRRSRDACARPKGPHGPQSTIPGRPRVRPRRRHPDVDGER
jgi:hypothetical protein